MMVNRSFSARRSLKIWVNISFPWPAQTGHTVRGTKKKTTVLHVAVYLHQNMQNASPVIQRHKGQEMFTSHCILHKSCHKSSYCARQESLNIRGWIQMVFYYHMIYSPETDGQVRHCSRLQSLRLQQINTYNDTYSVHDDVLMSCRAPSPSSMSSGILWTSAHLHWWVPTAHLFPPGRAESPPSPTFMVASFPLGPRTLSPLCLLHLWCSIANSCISQWRSSLRWNVVQL